MVTKVSGVSKMEAKTHRGASHLKKGCLECSRSLLNTMPAGHVYLLVKEYGQLLGLIPKDEPVSSPADTGVRSCQDRRSAARVVRGNLKLLEQIRMPANYPYLNDEHREATLLAWKASDLFKKSLSNQ